MKIKRENLISFIQTMLNKNSRFANLEWLRKKMAHHYRDLYTYLYIDYFIMVSWL